MTFSSVLCTDGYDIQREGGVNNNTKIYEEFTKMTFLYMAPLGLTNFDP